MKNLNIYTFLVNRLSQDNSLTKKTMGNGLSEVAYVLL